MWPLRSVDRGDAGVLLELIGGGVTVAWFAAGDEEAWGKTAPAPARASNKGTSGWLWARCAHGVVEVVDGLQGHAKLSDEGLDQEGTGGDDALISGQWCGARDGLQALVDDVGVTHVMGVEKALERGVDARVGRP